MNILLEHTRDEKRKPIRTSWGLLGEWWCVPKDMSGAERKEFVNDVAKAFEGNGIAKDLIEDRLFGCYPCDDSGRCHVYFSTGSYTFLNPEANTAMTAEDRAGVWKNLVEVNGEPIEGVAMFNDRKK